MREGKLEDETGKWISAASVVVWSFYRSQNAKIDLDHGFK